MAGKLVVSEPLLRQKAEKIVAWLSLIFTLIGVVEKSNHYVKLAQKHQQKHKHPIGFGPR